MSDVIQLKYYLIVNAIDYICIYMLLDTFINKLARKQIVEGFLTLMEIIGLMKYISNFDQQYYRC